MDLKREQRKKSLVPQLVLGFLSRREVKCGLYLRLTQPGSAPQPETLGKLLHLSAL